MFGLFGKHAQILHIVRLRNITDDHAPLVFEVIKMVIWKLPINCPAGLEIFLIDCGDLDDHMQTMEIM